MHKKYLAASPADTTSPLEIAQRLYFQNTPQIFDIVLSIGSTAFFALLGTSPLMRTYNMLHGQYKPDLAKAFSSAFIKDGHFSFYLFTKNMGPMAFRAVPQRVVLFEFLVKGRDALKKEYNLSDDIATLVFLGITASIDAGVAGGIELKRVRAELKEAQVATLDRIILEVSKSVEHAKKNGSYDKAFHAAMDRKIKEVYEMVKVMPREFKSFTEEILQKLRDIQNLAKVGPPKFQTSRHGLARAARSNIPPKSVSSSAFLDLMRTIPRSSRIPLRDTYIRNLLDSMKLDAGRFDRKAKFNWFMHTRPVSAYGALFVRDLVAAGGTIFLLPVIRTNLDLQDTTYNNVIAGALTVAGVNLATTPLDVWKTRFCGPHWHRSWIDVSKLLVASYVLRVTRLALIVGLVNGVGASMLNSMTEARKKLNPEN